MQLSWGGDPLFLMLAAMAMARQGHSALTLGRTDLADVVAQGEIDRLAQMARAHGLTPELVLHLAACATLAQGLTRATFLPLAAAEQQATGWTQPDAPAALFKLLQQGLPGPQGIAPVIPDMVGEALLVRLLRGEEGREAVLRCYAALGHRVAETAIRCVQDFAEVAAGPLGWLTGIVDTAQDDLEALAALANSLPMDSLALNATSLRVFQAVLERLAAMPDADPLACATAGMNLSRALAHVHQLGPALAVAEQAVLLLYPLALQAPDTYTLHLAVALNSLVLRQSDMGQFEDALETAQEAVLQAGALAHSNPDGAGSLLAMVLTNLTHQQSRLGQHGPALASAQQAVALYTHLADQWPAEFTAERAAAISNLGITYGNTQQHDEALRCALQTTDIYRRLAAQQPDTHRPALAKATTNLASAYGLLEQYGPALEAAIESMAQYTLLAAQNPDRFTPPWARSLGLLAQCHLDLQELAPARDHAHHGLQLLIPCFLQQPELHHVALSALLRIYLRACEANDVKPDAVLIEPLLPFIAEDTP